ncbi:MAG TPA: hypothetical protein VN578_00880 [Candidatus Binatia bacterium]|jgi:hypothetical protein|nr:hypothetical protein [Candidatus Binatia bacterium]
MKKSPLATILLTVLAIISLWSVLQCWSFISKSRELRLLQTKLNFINYRQAGINALAGDAVAYSREHHEIDPILESMGLKQNKSASVPTNKPASK